MYMQKCMHVHDKNNHKSIQMRQFSWQMCICAWWVFALTSACISHLLLLTVNLSCGKYGSTRTVWSLCLTQELIAIMLFLPLKEKEYHLKGLILHV